MLFRFYYENGRLYATLYEEDTRKSYRLSDDEISEVLDFVSKKGSSAIPKIANNDLILKYNGGIVRLKDYNKFKNDERFSFIFEKFSKKKVLDKKSIAKGGIIILASSVALASVFGILNNSNNKAKNIDNEIATYEASEEPSYDANTNYIDYEAINIQEPTVSEDDIVRNEIGINGEIDVEKARFTKENYWNIIEYYSNMYGVNPHIMYAIAVQERGVHATVIDNNGAIGLMQIQVDVWNNEDLRAYNYYTGNNDLLHITVEKLADLSFNIQVACAFYQFCFKQMKGNTLAALMAYNRGPTAAKNIITTYANAVGISYEEVLNNPNNLGWLNYQTLDYSGDEDYIRHVMRYFDGNFSEIGLNSTCKK